MVGYMPMPANFQYADVLSRGQPRHERFDLFRLRHPSMDTGKRAKIFAPFDALKGFNDAIRQRLGYSLEQIQDIWKAAIPFESLDSIWNKIDTDEPSMYSLFSDIPMPFEERIAEELNNEMLRKLVVKILSSLTEREEIVIKQIGRAHV